MTRWRRLLSYLRRVLRRDAADRELDEEIDAYVSQAVEARTRGGLTPAQARRETLVELGGLEAVKDRTRADRAGVAFDNLWQDARYAMRAVRHAPGFAISVAGSLAVGMAAVIAASAVIDAALFQPAAGVREPGALRQLTPFRRCNNQRADCWNITAVTNAEYRLMIESKLSAFDVLIADAFAPAAAALPEAHLLEVAFVSPGYFDVLQVRPRLGRAFAPNEASDPDAHVTVISHALWQRHFKSDPRVIGRSIRLAGQTVEIIGVAPPEFVGLVRGGTKRYDLWLPMVLADRVANERVGTTPDPLSVGRRPIRFAGRLKPGISAAQLRTEVDVLTPRLQAAGPEPNIPVWIDISRVGSVDAARALMTIGLLMPIPLLVLAIGCVNAANLLLARASIRVRETAVRIAIGASRARVVRQMLFESLWLAALSILLALPLAWVILRWAAANLELTIPFDAATGVIAVLAASASAIGFGLIPALRATAMNPFGALAQSRPAGGTPRQMRGRRLLVAIQVALSLGLLAAGIQLVNAMESEQPSAGTPAERLVMASINLAQPNIPEAEAGPFFDRLVEKLSRTPQIEAVGLAPQRLLWTFNRGHQADNSVVVWKSEDGPKDGVVYLGGYAGGRFFDAVGLKMLEGRDFTPEDQHVPRPRVAIVNLPFARSVFGGRALGKIVRVASMGQGHAAAVDVEIVGVVEPAQDPGFGRNGQPVPGLYVPVALRQSRALTVFARSAAPLDIVGPAIRAAVRDVNPDVPIALGTLATVSDEAGGKQMWAAQAAAVLGVAAMVLAAFGLYSLVSYLVAIRSREFAIRLALGAEPRGVLALVLRQSVALAGIGAAIGAVVAIATGQIIRSEVHSAPPVDLAALALSAAALTTAILAASIVPAARAARVSPIGLLKEE